MSNQNKKVMIVEDDSAILDIYKTVFSNYDFQVEAAASGKDTLRMIEEIKTGKAERPAVILLDLILPDMDGTEILKTIKSDDSIKDIKVFIMTNKEASGVNFPEGIKPDEFIVKANVTPMDIVELVKKYA